jgi:hypothetical protein
VPHVSSAHRITRSITAVICQGAQETLRTIDPGSLLISASPIDTAGMIEAKCEGKRVRVFARDLAVRSERIKAEAAKA